MRKHRLIAGVAASIAAVTPLAACGGGGPTTSQSKGSVSVLVVTDTSGPHKSYGSQFALSIRGAAAYLNTQGGILGRQVEVTVVNDNGAATTATSLLTKELTTNSGKYSFVWAGEEGSVIAATLPIIARNKVFAMAHNDANAICATVSNCPTTFTASGSNKLFPLAAAEWLKKKAYTNVGIIAEQLDFTQAEVPGLVDSLTKEQIKSTKVDFPSSAVKVTAELSRLKDAGVQAVYAAALGPAVGYVLDARAALGWNVPVVFDVAGSSLDVTKLVPASQLQNVYISPFYCMNAANPNPGWDLLNKNVPQPVDPTVGCNLPGFAWDAMLAFAKAAQKAGSLDPAAVSAAMETVKLSTTPDNVVTYQQYCWSSTNHENVCNQPSDWSIIPVGPIVNSRIQAAS